MRISKDDLGVTTIQIGEKETTHLYNLLQEWRCNNNYRYDNLVDPLVEFMKENA